MAQLRNRNENEAEVLGLLCSPKMKDEIEKAAPRHLDPERIVRIALTEMRRQPKLGKCTGESILGAVMVATQLGLEIDSVSGTWIIRLKRINTKNITVTNIYTA